MNCFVSCYNNDSSFCSHHELNAESEILQLFFFSAFSFKKVCKIYTLTIQIDQLPASLNKSLRANRFQNHKKNLGWDLLIHLETIGRKPPKPLERAKIEIVRHSHRTLDYDGLVGSLKPVVDALVTADILLDDRWNVLGKWDVDQIFRPRSLGPLLVIKITEIC